MGSEPERQGEQAPSFLGVDLGRGLHRMIAALLLATLTATAFYSSLGNDFVNWDDYDYVTKNPHIRSFDLDNIEGIGHPSCVFARRQGLAVTASAHSISIPLPIVGSLGSVAA